MSTPKPRIAIVGLGLIGRSIGLALRQAEVASAVVGHDRDRQAAGEAKSQGAVERVEWNLISTIEKADMVVLAEPLDGLESTLQAIGPYLRPGCVVMDTASLKGPVLAWAAQHLPPPIHFVGTDPILRVGADPGSARADLFARGLFCVVPSPAAGEAAVKLVTDMINILGAQPLFLDAAEHDGLQTGMDHLPMVLAVALLEMAVQQPTWRELRKMAGPTFEANTRTHVSAGTFGQICQLNRENLLRWIDAYTDALGSVRQAVAGGQGEELVQRFDAAHRERQKWLVEQGQGLWQEGPRVEMPPRASFLDTFLGTFWRKGNKKEP